MKIVVGLGNPGAKYTGTRHNVGFDAVDYLAGAPGVGAFRSAFQAQIAEATEAGEKVLLVKPETFMNLSGRAVRQVIDFYQVELTDLLVVCDDINLPLGLEARLEATATGAGRQSIDDSEPDIVSGAVVLLARIAQSYDDSHGSFPSQESI